MTCLSATDCWAVGGTASEGGPAPQPLIAHYTGGAWTVVKTPSIAGSGAELDAVACVGAGDCWAVGSGGGGPSALIEHLVGPTWTVVPSPTIAYGVSVTLNAVTCRAVDSCWAVGSNGAGDTLQPLIGLLSSAGWVVIPSPKITVPNGGELEGIACATRTNAGLSAILRGSDSRLRQGSGEEGSEASTQPLIEHSRLVHGPS